MCGTIPTIFGRVFGLLLRLKTVQFTPSNPTQYLPLLYITTLWSQIRINQFSGETSSDSESPRLNWRSEKALWSFLVLGFSLLAQKVESFPGINSSQSCILCYDSTSISSGLAMFWCFGDGFKLGFWIWVFSFSGFGLVFLEMKRGKLGSGEWMEFARFILVSPFSFLFWWSDYDWLDWKYELISWSLYNRNFFPPFFSFCIQSWFVEYHLFLWRKLLNILLFLGYLVLGIDYLSIIRFWRAITWISLKEKQ